MISKVQAQSTELHIHPTGWEANPESEIFPISLLGVIMPKIYVLITEVFSLPDNADVDAITKSMVAGLEFSLSQAQNRILTGTLQTDATSGEMWVEKKKVSTVSLQVKHMLGEKEFPSYHELADKDFPASLLAGNKLLPESVTAKQFLSPLGDNDGNDIPVATFQLNFIKGGFILAVAVHHVLSDGPGCEGFLTTWAENTVAAANATPFVPTKETWRFEGSPMDIGKHEASKMLGRAFPLVKDVGGPRPPPPADFKMPSLVNQMWHFPKSKAETLKKQASSGVKEGWISTYDAVMALLWSSVTRARFDLLKPDINSRIILIHGVDTRKVWDPPLPERFLGVGALGALCDSMTISDVMEPSNHSKLAMAVRSSIKEITPKYLTGLLQWIADRDDKRYLELDISSFLGPDFAGSSWAAMKSYERHDFGFGCPKALRWPCPQFEGFVFVYPSRAAQKLSSEDEGIEVCVCLEESCMQKLLQDEELLKYAHPRG
ncbi:hypothetical protein EJ02DRAFT_399503 [Clathrospora elynae]|uniref:Trichothecene 3-O-acetyltransferas-like protein n=1 Tax=Clathrospora elynae TaxID=706981 RepID=A0A6A5SW53_9PLEO|nr:hypothetical protein EJ02DRAFT_399503 [Clathrospora elynae]